MNLQYCNNFPVSCFTNVSIPTGTCGQDPMITPPFFFLFFFFFFFYNIDFFSYKQHFATFYVSLYDIYTINTIKQ
jgi:hypothetical protein